MHLETCPPRVDLESLRPKLEAQLGRSSILVYFTVMSELLGWNSAEYTEFQAGCICKIRNECVDLLSNGVKMYDLVGHLLYPTMHDVELWLRFFGPLLKVHIREMWYVTPYVPQLNTQLSPVTVTRMLRSVSHIFAKNE